MDRRRDGWAYTSPIWYTTTTELPRVDLHLPTGHAVEVLNQEAVIDALDNGHTIQVNG